MDWGGAPSAVATRIKVTKLNATGAKWPGQLALS